MLWGYRQIVVHTAGLCTIAKKFVHNANRAIFGSVHLKVGTNIFQLKFAVQACCMSAADAASKRGMRQMPVESSAADFDIAIGPATPPTFTCPVMSSGPSKVCVNMSRCHLTGTISVRPMHTVERREDARSASHIGANRQPTYGNTLKSIPEENQVHQGGVHRFAT